MPERKSWGIPVESRMAIDALNEDNLLKQEDVQI
jgi:hypothetical protein